MGSIVFFENMENFTPADYDELCIVNQLPPCVKQNSIRFKIKGKDVFFYNNLNKQEFINDTLSTNLPMKIGKFLVPEFANYIKLTIDDLKTLKPVIDKIDKKHAYEKVIYDAYIENNAFELTDEQRLNAYNEYKKER